MTTKNIRRKIMSSTFKFKTYTQGGMLIDEVDIPQSCVLWLNAQGTSDGGWKPNGLDELGETLKRVCQYRTRDKLKDYNDSVAEYEIQQTGKSYFQKMKELGSRR